jgi:hypothetical protein
MKTGWRLLIVLAILVAGMWGGSSAPDTAQAAVAWGAWLYNMDAGQLVFVTPGASSISMFPLPPDVTDYPYTITFSRDGGLLAACMTDTAGNPSVRVYDTASGIWTARYDIPGPIVDCTLSYYAFGPNATRLAVGIMNHYPDPGDPRPDWELIVLDVASGSPVQRVTSNDTAITSLGKDYSGHMPLVVMFNPNRIAFKPMRWGTEPPPEADSLVWQLGSGTVSLSGPYGKTGLDFLLPNSEMIWLEIDDTLPKGFLQGPGYLFNVVKYSNMTDEYIIFHDGEAVLYSPTFIEGGNRIAVRSYASPGPAQWLSYTRSGDTGLLPVDSEVYQVWGTSDGYVYLAGNSSTGYEFHQHAFTGDPFTPTDTIVWTAGAGTNWRVVWVEPLTTGAGLPAFAPLTMLGEPPVMPTDTVPPPAGGTLVIGGQARVNTTEGDLLRVRSGPGLGFGISFLVPTGTIVNIVEGPTDASGLTWWRIDVPGQGVGWAVEGVMDGGAYLPTLVPVP